MRLMKILGMSILFVLITATFGCVQDNNDSKNATETQASTQKLLDESLIGGDNPDSYMFKLPEGTQKIKVEYSLSSAGTLMVLTLNSTPTIKQFKSMVQSKQFGKELDSKTVNGQAFGTFELNSSGAKTIVVTAPGSVGTIKIYSLS